MRDVFRAFLKAASSGLLSAIFGILAMRILARAVGDQGIGLFSELREIQRIIVLIGTFGGGQAVIQGIAARTGEGKLRFSAEIFKIQAVVGLGLCCVLIGFSPLISQAVFGNQKQWVMFSFLSVPVMAAMSFSYVTSMINGRILVTAYAICQATLAIFLWLAVIPLSKFAQAGHDTAYLWILTFPFIVAALVGSAILFREGAFKKFGEFLRNKILWADIQIFLKIAGAMFLSQVLASAVILLLRTGLIHRYGLAAAGQFDPAWTISNVYLNGITSAFNVYYFPKLSALNDIKGRGVLTDHMLRLSAATIGIALVALMLSRNIVVDHLYGTQFLNATHSMRWMLIGDFFRISSLFPTVLLIGRNHIKPYIVLEVSMNVIFLAIGVFGLYTNIPLDILGVGYLASYVVRLVASLYYVAKKAEYRLSFNLSICWVLVLLGLIGADFSSWDINNIPVRKTLAFAAVVAIVIGGIFLMVQRQRNEPEATA